MYESKRRVVYCFEGLELEDLAWQKESNNKLITLAALKTMIE
jgi:hypothetical protein